MANVRPSVPAIAVVDVATGLEPAGSTVDAAGVGAADPQ
jgi:hypothetical protein